MLKYTGANYYVAERPGRMCVMLWLNY